MGDFNSQELSHLVWAAAVANVDCPAFFGAVASESAPRMARFNAQNMANVAWAFAAARFRGSLSDFFRLLASEAARRIGDFNAEDLATLASAFADLEAPMPLILPLFAAISEEAAVKDFTQAKDAAKLANAFTKLRLSAPPQIFQKIAGTITDSAKDDLVAFLSASVLATTGDLCDKKKKALPKHLVDQVVEKKDDFTQQQLASLVYALASLQEWGLCSDLAAQLTNVDDLDRTQKSRLFLVATFARLQQTKKIEFPLEARCLRSAYVENQSPALNFQKDLSAALDRLGWSHTVNHNLEDEGFSLDLAEPKLKICIQVDGPAHYLTDVAKGEPVLDSPTQFQSKIIRALGWKLARVSFFEWDTKQPAQRQHLLRKKLADIGVVTNINNNNKDLHPLDPPSCSSSSSSISSSTKN